MTVLTQVKVGLAIIGLAIFAAGIRFENSRLRLIGIGFVAIGWLLRFVKPRHRGAGDDQRPGA